MEAKEILYKTADYIETYGLQWDDYGEHGGARCVMGAIESVCSFPADASLSEMFDQIDDIFKPYSRQIEARFQAINDIIVDRLLKVSDYLPQFQDYMITWVDDFHPSAHEVVNTLRTLANEF